MFETACEYFSQGGFIIWPILILSLVMWILIMERVFYMQGEKRDGIYILNEFIKAFNKRSREAILETNYKYDCIIAKVLERVFISGIKTNKIDKDLLKVAIMEELPNLDKYIPIINVLAAAAPLLGLLGTVNGMITTFDVISIWGTGSPKSLAGGISEALITTQVGLIVAVPGLFAAFQLQKKAEAIKYEFHKINLRMNSIGI
ncbi:MAG: MotA/TolQ/ExbB proton channel family protein [bacterium]|nr:MotA/TolQ/ExbB proton channel family protein [bacterium]